MKKILGTISCIILILCLYGCPSSVMPRTYSYFDTYEDIKNHMTSGYIKPLRPDLTEEEYQEKCESGEFQDHGFHYRNYILTDLIGADEKITDGCYLINISGDNKASPYEIKRTLPVTFIYNVENAEGLFRIVLEIKPSSKADLDKIDEFEWSEISARTYIDYYFHTKNSRISIAPGFEPKDFVKTKPESLITEMTSYKLNNIIITFIYEVTDKEKVFEKNVVFENKIKDYILENIEIVSIE